MPAPPAPGAGHHGLARFVPIAVFLAVLGSIASSAFDALRRGERLGALIPLIVAFIVAVGWLRRPRRGGQR